MDAPPISFMDVMAEFEQAKAEHERALAEVAAMRAKVAAARSEYQQAEQTAAGHEQDMQRAAEQISVGLEQLQLASFVTQSLVEYHCNIGSYQCYLTTSDAKYHEIEPDSLRVDVQFPLVRLLRDGESWWETQIERDVEQAACVISIKVHACLSRNLSSRCVSQYAITAAGGPRELAPSRASQRQGAARRRVLVQPSGSQ